MINSRLLVDLDPPVRLVCTAHLTLCQQAGIDLIVTSTWRDLEAQAALYTIGRTTQLDRKPVTRAKAGQSWHNFRAAYDVVGVVFGKPIWKASDPIWAKIVDFGKQAGAEAGADWKTFKDLPHFQLVPKVDGRIMTLAEAIVQFQTTGTIFTHPRDPLQTLA